MHVMTVKTNYDNTELQVVFVKVSDSGDLWCKCIQWHQENKNDE